MDLKMDNLSRGKELVVGNGCMLIAVLFWGLNIPVTKVLIPDWMTSSGISASRIIGGCILFWIASIFLKAEPIRREHWFSIFLGGFVGIFAFIYFFIAALKFGSGIDISIIMTLPPMFVILIGVVFEKQRPAMLEYVGIIVSFIGAVIVIAAGYSHTQTGSDNILGDFLAIVSALCFAFYLVILEKPSRIYKPVSLLRWVYLAAALPALILLPGMQDMPIVHSTKVMPWLEIAFIVICPTFLGYFLVQPAMKFIGAELVSIYQYLIPVFAALFSVLMGVEEIKFVQIVAMCVIVIGMILTNIGKKQSSKKAVQAA